MSLSGVVDVFPDGGSLEVASVIVLSELVFRLLPSESVVVVASESSEGEGDHTSDTCYHTKMGDDVINSQSVLQH